MGPVYRLTGQLSGADAKFFAGFMAKNFVAGASHPGQMEREGLRLPPESPQRETAAEVAAGGKTAAPSGAVSSHTVRCAGSAGHGATEAARPERSLQARFFTHRTVATARNRASGFGGDWRVRKQLPVVVGPDDRMPPGSREPKWACDRKSLNVLFYMINQLSISCSLPGQALPATAGLKLPGQREPGVSPGKAREGLYLAASIMRQESKAGQKG